MVLLKLWVLLEHLVPPPEIITVDNHQNVECLLLFEYHMLFDPRKV